MALGQIHYVDVIPNTWAKKRKEEQSQRDDVIINKRLERKKRKKKKINDEPVPSGVS